MSSEEQYSGHVCIFRAVRAVAFAIASISSRPTNLGPAELRNGFRMRDGLPGVARGIEMGTE